MEGCKGLENGFGCPSMESGALCWLYNVEMHSAYPSGDIVKGADT